MMAGVSSVVKVKGKELDDDCVINLPPGFRFHPTDEEIITYYLTQKMMNPSFSAKALGEVDLNKCEPWDLPKKAKMGEKEWYFFCQRDRKYPTGMRTNRATESGYWKATGKDKEIYNNNNIKGEKVGGGGRRLMVGMKKTLVFYKGRAPRGEKTNWVMHEYRLEGKFSYYNFPKPTKAEWVVCRIFHKNTTSVGGTRRISPVITTGGVTKMSPSFGDDDDDDDDHDHDLLEYYCPDSQQLPPLMDPVPYSNQSRPTRSSFGIGDELIQGTNYYPTADDHKNSDSIFMYHDHQTLQFPNHHHQFFPFQDSRNIGNYDYLHQQRMGNSAVTPSFPGSNLKVTTDHQDDRHQIVQCKMEQQFSSNYQSMVTVSQEDTGLSTDMTTTTTPEISSSSLISKREAPASNIPYEELEDPSVGPFSDLDYLLHC